jgi:hypothetical protein
MLDVQPDPVTAFRLSTDRKTTPFARPRKGKGANGAEPLANAFGLPSGPDYSCENATEWCWPGTCYASKLETFPGVRNLLAHNWSVYQKYSKSTPDLHRAMDDMLDEFERACDKRGVAPVFRWFWDGDIPSREFAHAMRAQAYNRRHVQFWAYTRNFDAVPHLLHQPNLTVYLSVDNCNVDAALEMNERWDRAYGRNKPAKFAFCGDTWDETEELAARFKGERTGPRCPELTGKIPMVVWGSEGTGRGACVECGMCLTGINNVRFSSQKG